MHKLEKPRKLARLHLIMVGATGFEPAAFLIPNQTRYQAAPRPNFFIISSARDGCQLGLKALKALWFYIIDGQVIRLLQRLMGIWPYNTISYQLIIPLECNYRGLSFRAEFTIGFGGSIPGFSASSAPLSHHYLHRPSKEPVPYWLSRIY